MSLTPCRGGVERVTRKIGRRILCVTSQVSMTWAYRIVADDLDWLNFCDDTNKICIIQLGRIVCDNLDCVNLFYWSRFCASFTRYVEILGILYRFLYGPIRKLMQRRGRTMFCLDFCLVAGVANCMVEVCCFGPPCPSLLLARCFIVDIFVMEAG